MLFQTMVAVGCVIGILFSIFVLACCMSQDYPYKRVVDTHRMVNVLYKCWRCERWSRKYQLDARDFHCECGNKIDLLCFERDEHKWMKYADDFPRLSIWETRKCLQLLDAIECKQNEIEAYLTWKKNWRATYNTEPPIPEEQVIRHSIDRDVLAMINEGKHETFDSIRLSLGYPILK